MNADILPMNTSKCAKPKKNRNAQNRRNNSGSLQATRDISETCPVVENLNQPTEQKQKLDSSNSTQVSHTSPLSTKDIYSAAGKRQVYKLIDSKQVSKPFHQSDKKTSLLDTYARIVASNNKRCPKRLRELAKPKRQAYDDWNDDCPVNFDLNRSGAIDKTGPKRDLTRRIPRETSFVKRY